MALSEMTRQGIRDTAEIEANKLLRHLKIGRKDVSDEAYAQIVANYDGIGQLSELLDNLRADLLLEIGTNSQLEEISEKLEEIISKPDRIGKPEDDQEDTE